MGQVVDEIDWWKVDILFIDQSIPIITPLNLSFFLEAVLFMKSSSMIKLQTY